MKIAMMIAAAGALIGAATPALAYPGDHGHRGGWNTHRHCHMERHHHRQVRVCR